jgi:hypothetical protein
MEAKHLVVNDTQHGFKIQTIPGKGEQWWPLGPLSRGNLCWALGRTRWILIRLGKKISRKLLLMFDHLILFCDITLFFFRR